MTNWEDICSRIDFVLLEEQKNKLVRYLRGGGIIPDGNSLSGIVHLLDVLQDEAIRLGLYTPKE